MATALPTVQDVTLFLTGFGITLPPLISIAPDVADAIDEWNRRTGYRPFFQTSSSLLTVTFDPPGPDQFGVIVGGSSKLALGNGLLSVTSVVNDLDPSQPGNAGNTLNLGIDYWLDPSIAPTQVPPEPYTRIIFGYPQRGLRQSIQVEGIWGYCQGTLPDDAWAAIRDLAAARVLEGLLQALSTKVITVKDIDQEKQRSPQLIANLGKDFRARAKATLSRYRLLNY